MLDLRGYLITNCSGQPQKAKPQEISIDCPNCGKGKMHFSFNIVKNSGGCFKCGYAVNSAISLLMKLESVSELKARQFLSTGAFDGSRASAALNILGKRNIRMVDENIQEHINADLPEEYELCYNERRDPKFICPSIFMRRGYPKKVIAEMKIGFCNEGHYAARLIFPIECINFRSFYAMRLRPEMEPKYKNPPNTMHSLLLYNYDKIIKYERTVFIVEGATDVLRLISYGYSVVGVSGKKISSEQIDLLVDKKPYEVICIFDGDAIKENRKSFIKLSYRLNASYASLPEKGVIDGKIIYHDPDDVPRSLLEKAINERTGMSRLQNAVRILKRN